MFYMGRCSSCGVDLAGYGELCPKCYRAQDAALIPQKDSSRHGWFSYMHVLLWIFVSYLLVTYMPASAMASVLLVGLAVIFYLFLWAYSKRPRKKYITPQETFSLVLGLCCAVIWKITGADAWGRLGIACVFAGACYRAVYRVIDRIHESGSDGSGPNYN